MGFWCFFFFRYSSRRHTQCQFVFSKIPPFRGNSSVGQHCKDLAWWCRSQHTASRNLLYFQTGLRSYFLRNAVNAVNDSECSIKFQRKAQVISSDDVSKRSFSIFFQVVSLQHMPFKCFWKAVAQSWKSWVATWRWQSCGLELGTPHWSWRIFTKHGLRRIFK